MSSVTLTRRAHKLDLIREHQNNQPYNIDEDDKHENTYDYSSSHCSTINKPIRALSFDQVETQSTKINNNRFKHLCSRLKRRLTLTKEYRTHSDDTNENTSKRYSTHLSNCKTFSVTTTDESLNDIQWPDFEKVYEAIPSCLINALPGLDDFSIGEQYDQSLNIINFQIDQYSIETMNLFIKCKRGKDFRRNAICVKLDKNQYNGQLDIFIQQIMVEKLMRTWT